MRRQRWTSRRILVGAVLVATITGCGQAAVSATGQPTDSAPTVAATIAATAVPATPEPTVPVEPPRSSPSTDMPAGYRAGRTAPFGFGLVVGDVLMGWNMDEGEVYRWDAATFEELGTHEMGKGFPPSAQSAAIGADGVWINLASERAVALMDPETGKIVRRVEIQGYPYDMVEVAGELWIVDFEWSELTRYDLATDAVIAEIPVSLPTDVVFGEGAIWVPLHFGRASESEPITAGGQVARIDPATNEITIRSNVGPRPYYLATGFGAAWTGTATGASVDRVDAATGAVTTIWAGEDGVFDIEVVGDSVWAVPGPQWPPTRMCDPETSFFVRIDPTTNTVRERIAFPCPGSITPDGDGFWVAGGDADGPVTVFFEPIGG